MVGLSATVAAGVGEEVPVGCGASSLFPHAKANIKPTTAVATRSFLKVDPLSTPTHPSLSVLEGRCLCVKPSHWAAGRSRIPVAPLGVVLVAPWSCAGVAIASVRTTTEII
jgi:hypothetical protein